MTTFETVALTLIAGAVAAPWAASAACSADDANADAWFALSFTARTAMFSTQSRDSTWAHHMEAQIRQHVSGFREPTARLHAVECRRTLCRLTLSWPRRTGRGVVGQQVSTLYRLGLDHQGETPTRIEDDGLQVQMIVRARERWSPSGAADTASQRSCHRKDLEPTHAND